MASGNRFSLVAAGAAVALAALACTPAEEPATITPAGTEEGAAPAEWSASGPLNTPDQASNAFTYDPALAPVGAELAVTISTLDGSTAAELEADGLLPDRGYAVHLHTNPCGPTGADAGPHFQNQIDPAATPEAPSTDPAYANPENEFWLDLVTDDTGSGTASVEVPFVLTDDVPRSLVVHAEPETATGPGEAGTAGDRVACLTIPTE